jgi:GTPase SAR1 family protein
VDLREEYPQNFFLTCEEGEKLAEKINARKFIETSAKNNFNVKFAFESAIEILGQKEKRKVEEIGNKASTTICGCCQS